MIPISKVLRLRNKNMTLKNFHICLFTRNFLNEVKVIQKSINFRIRFRDLEKCNGANDDLKAQMDTLMLEVYVRKTINYCTIACYVRGSCTYNKNVEFVHTNHTFSEFFRKVAPQKGFCSK